jgi:hypothetical protein
MSLRIILKDFPHKTVFKRKNTHTFFKRYMKFTPSSCFKNSFLAPVIIFLALALLLMAGCADENPALVNPGGGNDSITIRFVNFASDGLPRTFTMEGAQAVNVGYGQSSILQRSLTDSAAVTVSNGGVVNFKTENKIIFGKNTVQTIVALPSGDSAVARLLNLSASYIQPTNTTGGFVRFFNAFYDTTKVYSLRIGCPNGAMFGAQMPFGGAGIFTEIPQGEVVVSVLSRNALNVNSPETIVGTYRFNVATLRSYTIFAFKNSAGDPEFLVLDELNGATSALKPIEKVLENTVEIRTVNFSQAAVDIFNQSKHTIASGIETNSIGRFESIVTCNGTGADSLSVFSEGVGTPGSSIITSLDVLKKYSVIVLDSGSGRANYSILVPPAGNYFKTPGTATIRVVNATTLFKNITVSLGAQNDLNSTGYRSGGTLASGLLKGQTAGIAEVKAGKTPLTIFTSSQPAQLLFTTAAEMQAGVEYLLIVHNTASGDVRTSLLKSTDEAQNVEFLKQGVFMQIVHGVPGLDKLQLSVGNSLNSATLFYRGSLATVVEPGTTELRVGNVFKNIPFSADSNMLIVIAGTAAQPEILTFSKPNVPLAPGTLERRIIHASKELGTFTAFANDTVDWAERLAENLDYGEASQFQWLNTERRLSVIFLDPNSTAPYFKDKTYFRTENISFPLGKRYSLIVVGAKEAGGYSVITQQEF